MAYWRMQLHPDESGEAVKHTVESLAAGYIGLDFRETVGDLTTIEQDTLPETQRKYWQFAHGMQEGDYVLIITHHFPFALVRIAGPYNYIKTPVGEIGVWFRHFRKVDNVRYYSDHKTNALEWERTTMTDTISPLHTTDGISYRLIENWLHPENVV